MNELVLDSVDKPCSSKRTGVVKNAKGEDVPLQAELPIPHLINPAANVN